METKRSFLIFSLSSRKFAIDVKNILRIIRIVEVTPVPKSKPSLVGVIDYHGMMVPILNLHRRFGFKLDEKNLLSNILLIKDGEITFGFIVDEVGGVFLSDELELVESEKIIPGLGGAINEIGKYKNDFIMLYELEKILTREEKEIITEVVSDQND